MREEEAVDSYIRYHSTLAKTIQVGDPKQLPPCIMSQSHNESALHIQGVGPRGSSPAEDPTYSRPCSIVIVTFQSHVTRSQKVNKTNMTLRSFASQPSLIIFGTSLVPSD